MAALVDGAVLMQCGHGLGGDILHELCDQGGPVRDLQLEKGSPPVALDGVFADLKSVGDLLCGLEFLRSDRGVVDGVHVLHDRRDALEDDAFRDAQRFEADVERGGQTANDLTSALDDAL